MTCSEPLLPAVLENPLLGNRDTVNSKSPPRRILADMQTHPVGTYAEDHERPALSKLQALAASGKSYQDTMMHRVQASVFKSSVMMVNGLHAELFRH